VIRIYPKVYVTITRISINEQLDDNGVYEKFCIFFHGVACEISQRCIRICESYREHKIPFVSVLLRHHLYSCELNKLSANVLFVLCGNI